MNSTALPVILLVVTVLLLEGCSLVKKKRATFQGWPVLRAQDHPVKFRDYDEDIIRKKAGELGMRPVDYLHHINNKRHTGIKRK